MADKGSLEDLLVWRRALDFVDAVYALTKRWPKDEVFGLTNQVRRAAVSIPSNIAEGQGRRNDGDFLRFLAIALGSLMEVKTQLIIGRRQGFATEDEVAAAIEIGDEVARMLVALRRSLTARKARK
jgi:four helix bundle protein